MNDIKEIPVAFGPDQSLVGVVAAPTGGDDVPIACLLLNVGANHRIGPRRINVKLARQLAECGVSSIRFDLSGLGDSGPARGAEHFLTQAVHDLQAAMNLVETMLGIRRFVVIGLCSGATHGMALALADARVIGLLLFDGPAFPGRRSLWERSARRAIAAVANPAVLGKMARWLQRRFSAKAAAAMAPLLFDSEPPEMSTELFRRSMVQAAERRIAVLMVYSGTFHVVDRDRDQLGLFAHEPFMRGVEYRFEGGIDHSLTSIAAQQIFMAVAADWVMRVANARATAPADHRSGTDFAQLAIH